jgi:hypothetical protein
MSVDDKILEAVMHDLLVAEVEEEPATAAGLAEASKIVAAMQERIAAERRSMVPAARPLVQMEPIRPSLLRMKRDELIAKVKELFDASPGLSIQVAYREATYQTDHDLRVLIMALESAKQKGLQG